MIQLFQLYRESWLQSIFSERSLNSLPHHHFMSIIFFPFFFCQFNLVKQMWIRFNGRKKGKKSDNWIVCISWVCGNTYLMSLFHEHNIKQKSQAYIVPFLLWFFKTKVKKWDILLSMVVTIHYPVEFLVIFTIRLRSTLSHRCFAWVLMTIALTRCLEKNYLL